MSETSEQTIASPASTINTQAPRKRPVSTDTMSRWRKEEPALIRAWQEENSEQALETLVRRYTSMFKAQISKILAGRAVSIAHRADLEQEAALAFVEAVNRFDFSRETQLSTLAANYIRNSLLTYTLSFRNGYRIGTSSDERKAYYAALSMRAARMRKGKSDILDNADIAHIQASTGASAKATKRAVEAIYTQMTGVEAAADLTPETCEITETDTDMSVSCVMEMLAPVIEAFDDRKKVIFAQQSGALEIDNHQIADRFQITTERVGQIRREMMAELHETLIEMGIDIEDVI
jgi:RNA polymerase sigma factor (sigma-70 family)